MPEGTSDDLAYLLRAWAEVYRLAWAAESDDDQASLSAESRGLIGKIASYESASCADIAAKLNLGLFELKGAARFDHPGITADGDLLIQCGVTVDRTAEVLLMAAAKDVLTM